MIETVLWGQTALVTGASSGIGVEIAGWINKSTIFFTRIVPRQWLAGITDWLMKVEKK